VSTNAHSQVRQRKPHARILTRGNTLGTVETQPLRSSTAITPPRPTRVAERPRSSDATPHFIGRRNEHRYRGIPGSEVVRAIEELGFTGLATLEEQGID
jgi:hypothetical protein